MIVYWFAAKMQFKGIVKAGRRYRVDACVTKNLSSPQRNLKFTELAMDDCLNSSFFCSYRWQHNCCGRPPSSTHSILCLPTSKER